MIAHWGQDQTVETGVLERGDGDRNTRERSFRKAPIVEHSGLPVESPVFPSSRAQPKPPIGQDHIVVGAEGSLSEVANLQPAAHNGAGRGIVTIFIDRA